VPSLLVTNDFPPKVGGIQSYLWELWRRLPADQVTVLTTAYPGAVAFDAEQPFRIERVSESVLWPTARLAARVEALAHDVGAGVVFVDPLLPVGRIVRRIRNAATIAVVHGAEVTVPGRLPVASALVRDVLRRVDGIVAAGGYPAEQAVRVAGRPLAGVVVPPGVDSARFHPLTDDERRAARREFGLDPDAPTVVGLSRLVPRKGFDVLIDAVAGLDARVQLVIAGRGRDRARLERRARRRGVRVTFLGRVDDDALPVVAGMGDVFAMVCRNRWLGLEQEGFGIVFLEAAACGVPAIAGRSGGTHEAVVDGVTGAVVEPRDVRAVRSALAGYLDAEEARAIAGQRARERAVAEFDSDLLVGRLLPLAQGDLSGLATIAASTLQP